MSDFEWLQTICSTAEARATSLGHPWTIQRKGEPYTVATDGVVLVMIAGDHGFTAADSRAPKFASVLTEPDGPPSVLPLPHLREIAAPWANPEIPDCVVCANTGTIKCATCEGDGQTDCECHCGDVHEADCDDCDGKGTVGCDVCPRGASVAPSIRPVHIGVGLFDLRIIARLLPHIDGDVAEFRQAQPNRAAFLRIGPWTVVLMPLRPPEPGDTKWADAAPRIEFAEPAASLLSLEEHQSDA